MIAVPAPPPAEIVQAADQRIRLHGVPWSHYEILLAVRGECAVPRITYLEGELELMSPSEFHESIKTMLARLLEIYAVERNVDLRGYGSWTLKRQLAERGAEPDECYVLGPRKRDIPDLAIEVVWTSGGIDKLEVYRGLEVPEVWFWRDGAVEIHRLAKGGYQRATGSAFLPELDLDLIASFARREDQTAAVREYARAIRRKRVRRTRKR